MGSILVLWALALIISLFAFRTYRPHARALLTTATAWIFFSAVAAFGWGFFVTLIASSIGAVVVAIERYIHYSKHWTDEPEKSELSDTFR